MKRVLAIKLAELHLFQTARSIALFLGRSIITTLALRAFHNYQFTHFSTTLCFVLHKTAVSPFRGKRQIHEITRIRLTDPGILSSKVIIQQLQPHGRWQQYDRLRG